MNNFTKEELEQLRWVMCEAGKGQSPLCYKIQIMIYNYDKKPTVGLFGNETKNKIHANMMDRIFERLSRLEARAGFKPEFDGEIKGFEND